MLIHERMVAGRRMLMPRRKYHLVYLPSDRARLGRPSLPNAVGLLRNQEHLRGQLMERFGSRYMIKVASRSRSGVRAVRTRQD